MLGDTTRRRKRRGRRSEVIIDWEHNTDRKSSCGDEWRGGEEDGHGSGCESGGVDLKEEVEVKGGKRGVRKEWNGGRGWNEGRGKGEKWPSR